MKPYLAEFFQVVKDLNTSEQGLTGAEAGRRLSETGPNKLKEGKKVSFTARVKAGGQEGAKAGKDLAEELIKRYSNDYVLVIVAGMNYAEYVEAMDNKDVLASTELWAPDKIPQMIAKLKRQMAT